MELIVNKEVSKQLLNAVKDLVVKTKGKNIHSALIEELQSEINAIKLFFGISDFESIILSIYINCAIKDSSVEMDRLIDHFGKDISMLSDLNEALDTLISRRILVSRRHDYSAKPKSNFNKELLLSSKVLDALIKGNKDILQPAKVENFFAVLYEARELIAKRIDKEISTEQLGDEIMGLLANNKKLIEIEWILSIEGANRYDIILLLDLAIEHFEGAEEVDLDKLVSDIFSEVSDRVRYKKGLKEEKNILFLLGYIEFSMEEFSFLNYIKLGDESMDVLLGGYKDSAIKKYTPKMGDLIFPEQINCEELFYNIEEKDQIELLTSALSEERFDCLMDELGANGMKKGFTILLHGYPGTGKTSSVKQIAKKTNRQIFLVDIAKVQSKWVGESEKNISKIFEEYKRCKKSYPATPILLFNEADAILGKRTKVNSSVDKSFNTIQNMLLQELEDFEGIFMATTNLANELDEAFDRRLLYKVEFKKPSKEVRTQILKSNFKNVPDGVLNELKEFTLTGGQIANIKKKMLVKTILQKPENELDTLIEICTEELSLIKSKIPNQIGFLR
jgi:Cdc6-like AAA superfamily ATPase